MRPWFTSILLILVATPAMAQNYYAEQTYPAPNQYPAQQQVSGNYYPNAPVAPPQPQYAQPQPQRPAAQPEAHPWDYGQSVTTDIRQMNF